MSTSLRDQRPHRRNRVYGAHDIPAARSSGLSLASNTTATTHVSGGSASTTMQDTHLRPKNTIEKRKKTRTKSDVARKAGKSMAEAIQEAKDTNVFQFLIEREDVEDNESDPDQCEPPQPEMEMKTSLASLIPRPEIVVQSDESDTEGFYKSQLSDSGISMSSSIGEVQLEPYRKQPLPPLIEESNDYTPYVPPSVDHPTQTPSVVEHLAQPLPMIEPNYAPSIADTFYHHEPQMWTHYQPTAYTPEPVPLSPASIRSHAYPHEYVYRGTPEPPSTEEPSISCLDSAPLVFRDMGRNETLQPNLFRSFAKVNTRVLLQMQTNIAELEHELAIMDAKTLIRENSTRRKSGDHHHSSKRFTKDQAYRADLYQELHTSLEQYHEALSSYHRMTQLAPFARPADVSSHRKWLESHVIPQSKIPPLIGDGSDLMMLGHSFNGQPEQTLRVVAYSVFTNVFVPLLLFRLSSGVLSRLIVLSLTTTAGALVLERHRINTQMELGDLHWNCILGCAGVSMLAALLF